MCTSWVGSQAVGIVEHVVTVLVYMEVFAKLQEVKISSLQTFNAVAVTGWYYQILGLTWCFLTIINEQHVLWINSPYQGNSWIFYILILKQLDTKALLATFLELDLNTWSSFCCFVVFVLKTHQQNLDLLSQLTALFYPMAKMKKESCPAGTGFVEPCNCTILFNG